MWDVVTPTAAVRAACGPGWNPELITADSSLTISNHRKQRRCAISEIQRFFTQNLCHLPKRLGLKSGVGKNPPKSQSDLFYWQLRIMKSQKLLKPIESGHRKKNTIWCFHGKPHKNVLDLSHVSMIRSYCTAICLQDIIWGQEELYLVTDILDWYQCNWWFRSPWIKILWIFQLRHPRQVVSSMSEENILVMTVPTTGFAKC